MNLLQSVALVIAIGTQLFFSQGGNDTSVAEVHENSSYIQGYDVPETDEEISLEEYLRINHMTLYEYYLQNPGLIFRSARGETPYQKATYTQSYWKNPNFSVTMVMTLEVYTHGGFRQINSVNVASYASSLGTNGTAWNQTNSMTTSALPSTSVTGTVVGYFTASGYAKGFTKGGDAPYQSDVIQMTRTYTLN